MGKKKKRSPAFQFWPKDFLSSMRVQAMSVEEVGAYFLLLINSWLQEDQCYLPADDELLRKVSRMVTEQWVTHRSVILSCFEEEDGRIFNRRLLQVKQEQDAYHENKRASGAKAAAKRWQKDGSGIGDPYHTHSKRIAKRCQKDASSSSSSSSSINSPSGECVPAPKKGKPQYTKEDEEKFIDAWNATLGVTQIREWNQERRKSFRARCKEPGGLEKLMAALEHIRKTPALRGETDAHFHPKIRWFLSKGKANEILEGNYDDWGANQTTKQDVNENGYYM